MARDFGDSFPTRHTEEVEKITVREVSWLVKREGKIEEVHHTNGRITYRVKINDAGRNPFITENYNDQSPADDFLDRVKEENEAHTKE